MPRPEDTGNSAVTSGTPDSLWRSLNYFNYYRLAAATLLFVAMVLYQSGPQVEQQARTLFVAVDVTYWVVALFFVVSHRRLHLRFNRLLTLQVVTDVVAITFLVYASGGQKSGLAFMLLVVVAGAGLVGKGRMALFYAALATIGVLLEESYRALTGQGEGDFVRVAVTSIGFFATAMAAALLARRVIANEELARQRGAQLADQLRVNERIIRDMLDGVLVVDREGVVRQSNPQADLLLGAPAAGRRLADILPEAAQDLLQADAEGVERERSTALAPGGKSVRTRAVGTGGDLLVFVEDVGRMQAQAQQLKLAALGRLTASIAHEIRNPLSAISQAADLLREEKRADMQMRLTRIIRDNAQRLERMVRDVLELGHRDRIEPERLKLASFLPVFLDEICMHEQVARERFATEIEDGAAILFDRAHFNQVMWNLLTNALRHGSGGPGGIRLKAVTRPAANRCELHVIDDGPGIDDKLVGQVFEPFFTTHSKGTGLGLFIARELCDANGAALSHLGNDPGAHFCVAGRVEK